MEIVGSTAARAPRPPQFKGGFAPPRAPTQRQRQLRAARPTSARTARTFRQATDVPQRPSSAGAPRSRPIKTKSLTTQRKGKLVNSLRKEQVVNALFLCLQCGGPSADLKQLARLAQGGVHRAPQTLVTLVEKEAYNLMAELDEAAPAQTAMSARVPGRFSHALSSSPRGKPQSSDNKLSTSLGGAHLRILAAVKAEEAKTASDVQAASDMKDRLSQEPPVEVTKPAFVRPAPVVVNVCGRNIELLQFLTEKIMARDISDNRNIRHMLLKHDQNKCGAITREQFEDFLHSVQVFLAPAELTKVFDTYGTADGMIDYTGLAAALIPSNYPAAQQGWVQSLAEKVMQVEQAPPKATHLVGISQDQYDELVAPTSPRRRRQTSKPAVPRQAGSPRAASAVGASRAYSHMGGAETERVKVPTAWGVGEPERDVLGDVRNQLLQKRGGPAQWRRLFMFLDKQGGGTIKTPELAEVMLSMGMSSADLDTVIEAMDAHHVDVDGAGFTYTQFCEFINGKVDDKWLDRFDPSTYPHHDYTKLQERMRKNQEKGTAFSHAAAQVPARKDAASVGAPPLRSFEALQRVLRDKTAARSRYIRTELRATLMAQPQAGGCASPFDIQQVMTRYGVEICKEDLLTITDRFSTDGDGAVDLIAFIDWVLPDDDHDYVSKNHEFCIKNEEFCIKNDEFCRPRNGR